MTEKPFSTIGTLVFRSDGEAKFFPSCIMCGRILQNESYVTKHKRNYVYFVCEDCFQEHSAEEFEERTTFLDYPRIEPLKDYESIEY